MGVRLKHFAVFVFFLSSLACSNPHADQSASLTILLNQSPLSLNPRSTTDAAGQHLNALLYRGLVHLNADLQAEPDLAQSWRSSDDGKEQRFRILPGLKDHQGAPITAELIAECLEEYRVGKPVSTYAKSFPTWKKTQASSDEVVFTLSEPSPYLTKDLSALKYFRVPGAQHPCTEPDPEKPLIGSGIARLLHWSPTLLEDKEFDFELLPSHRLVRFEIIQDENTRVLKLIQGEIDVAQNAFALPKERWFIQHYSDRFLVLERAATTVSYLGFNLNDPLLSKREIRKAIAIAIDRESVVRDKMYGFGSVAGGLLSPPLAEYFPIHFDYSPTEAEKLLDQAGFPRGKDGVRFQLHYKCTSAREGMDQARIFQEMLGKVGIDVKIDMVERSVFTSSILKGNFQLFSSTWVGVADGLILDHVYRTGQPGNRENYSNPEMDRLMLEAISEPKSERRREILKRAQQIAADDLPVFPLWYWNNSVFFKKQLHGLRADQISLSSSLEPLLELK